MDVLERIGAYKREEIAAAKRARPLSAVENDAKAQPAPRGFVRAIEAKLAAQSIDSGEAKKRLDRLVAVSNA